ncbi:MAG: hypothetical protein WB607_09685 [Candidatus Acidiferrum sp.]
MTPIGQSKRLPAVTMAHGSHGIGAAIARRLAADRAHVAITFAKDASAASAVVVAIKPEGVEKVQ